MHRHKFYCSGGTNSVLRKQKVKAETVMLQFIFDFTDMTLGLFVYTRVLIEEEK